MRGLRTQYLLPAVICAIIILLLSSSAAAGVVYVRWNAAGTPDGKSWDTAYRKVQDGVNSASSGDEVWVAAGVYTENITIKDGVAVYGGFSGTETSREHRDWHANRGVLKHSHVTLYGCNSRLTRLDGFTRQVPERRNLRRSVVGVARR